MVEAYGTVQTSQSTILKKKETTELVEIRKKIPEKCCLSMRNSLSWMFNNQRRRTRGAIYTFRLQTAL